MKSLTESPMTKRQIQLRWLLELHPNELATWVLMKRSEEFIEDNKETFEEYEASYKHDNGIAHSGKKCVKCKEAVIEGL